VQKKEQDKAKQLENTYDKYINTDNIENFDEYQIPDKGQTI